MSAASPRDGKPRTEPVRVRRMREDDAARVAALSGQLGYPCGAGAMRRRIREQGKRADGVLFIAEGAGRTVIGWTQVEERRLLETGRFAELTGLVVDECARGLGAGRALVAAAEAWARSRGHATLRLRSNRRRRAARAFYERVGYAVFKTQNVFARRLRGRAPPAPALEGDPRRRPGARGRQSPRRP